MTTNFYLYLFGACCEVSLDLAPFVLLVQRYGDFGNCELKICYKTSKSAFYLMKVNQTTPLFHVIRHKNAGFCSFVGL